MLVIEDMLCRLPIFLIGFMGSGKSFLGQYLAEKYHLPFIDLDIYIAKQEQKTIAQLFALYGEDGFRQKENYHLQTLITKSFEGIIACGGGTPCFYDNITLMNKNGTTIFLNTSIMTIYERLQHDTIRPLLTNYTASARLPFLTQKLEERLPYYNQAQYILDDEQINLILQNNAS